MAEEDGPGNGAENPVKWSDLVFFDILESFRREGNDRACGKRRLTGESVCSEMLESPGRLLITLFMEMHYVKLFRIVNPL